MTENTTPAAAPTEAKHDDHDHHDHDHAHAGEHKHTVTAVLEELGPCKRLLKVSVPANEVKEEIDRQLAQVRKQAAIKGFRKGKVPQAMVKKLYGDSIKEDVKKHLLEHSYFLGLEQQKIDPKTLLGEARVENLKFSETDGLAYEITLLSRPTFELPEYKGLEIALPQLKVEEQDVDRALDNFRRARGEIRPVDDKNAIVEAEDFLLCDVEVWLQDEWETKFGEGASEEKKPEEKKEGEDLPGALKALKELKDVEIHVPVGTVGPLEVEDLSDSLVGLTVGETADVETTLPADYEVVEGRNEDAMLRVKVNSIKRLFLPPLTEEWVKESGYDSIDELKRRAREDLFAHKEQVRSSEIEDKVLDTLIAKTGGFALPQDLIDAEFEDHIRRKAYELTFEGKSEEEAKRQVEGQADDIRTTVIKNLRSFFIMDEIAKREKIKVSESDIDARVSRLAQRMNRNPAEVRKQLEERNVVAQLRTDILTEKTRGFLREHAKVVDRTD